ncbi:MAG: hypothetical protein QHJ73_10605, partial [Armatimonadota bacterium]|nr:hypothetical protein [Armatimonadota bacterium]
MSCRTPGCGGVAKEGWVYCERCGWPLALGRVAFEPDEARLRGERTGRVLLKVDNHGAGPLRWKVTSCPNGVVVDVTEGEVAPGSETSIDVTLDPASLPRGDCVEVGMRLWDRVGEAAYRLREDSPDECWRDVVVPLKVRRQRYGQLEVPWRTLFFGGNVWSGAVTIRNAGEAEMNVTARVAQGYEVEAVGTPRGERLQTVVPGGESRVVTVVARSEEVPERSLLVFEADGLPPVEVSLVRVSERWVPPPEEPWVVAIDLGTTKSAVAVFDQQRRGAEPEPLMWRGPGEDSPWLPSIVTWDGDRPTHFGWEADPEAPGVTVVRALKMRLREEDERVQRSIVFFLRQLLQRAAVRIGGNGFANTRVVFTLPVLDNGPEYQKQKALTLRAALEAGKPYGLREEQISFYHEPECAAVDFFYHLREAARKGKERPVLPEDWLCVLDMGGGTTDISFVRFKGIEDDGVLVFDEVHSLGFPGCAGDHIDEEFWRWCIKEWEKKGRLKKDGTKPAPTPQDGKHPAVSLEGETETIRWAEGIKGMCVLKEKMYASSPPKAETFDIPTREENKLTLCPKTLGRDVLKPMAREVFVDGVRDSDKYPSVRQWMDKIRLTADRIRFLCLTGGTSQIPDFKRVLR